LKVVGGNGLIHSRGGGVVFGFDFLADVKQTHRVAGSSVGAVDETVDARDVVVVESDGFEGGLDSTEILSADQGVNIAGVSDSGNVDSGHPRGDGVPTGDRIEDRIGDLSILDRTGRTQAAFFDGFHSGDPPLPGEGFEFERLFLSWRSAGNWQLSSGVSANSQQPTANRQQLLAVSLRLLARNWISKRGQIANRQRGRERVRWVGLGLRSVGGLK